LTRADEITGGTDDLGVCSENITDGLTVIWVAEDDGAADEGVVLSAEHRCCVVDDLASLTVELLASITVIVEH
jgi:hypothetical protein